MNLAEFKAWFEGFTESMEGAPTRLQWERIKEQIESITPEPTPTPMPDLVDRYVRPMPDRWAQPHITWQTDDRVVLLNETTSGGVNIPAAMSGEEFLKTAGMLEYDKLAENE